MSAEMKRPIEGVTREAMALLMSYPFPGNVRELRNLLERAMVVSPGPLIGPADLSIPVGASQSDDSLDSVERLHITRVLEQSGGNVSHAARVLGIDRVTLYNKIRNIPAARAEMRTVPHPAIDLRCRFRTSQAGC